MQIAHKLPHEFPESVLRIQPVLRFQNQVVFIQIGYSNPDISVLVLIQVRDRTCVGDWAGVAPGGSFKTVDRVSVCDWMGHISITETQLIKRALRDARI